MARSNEILVGRFNRFLQKLTGIKGGPVSPQLAGEIQPVISFFTGIENRYLDGWERFGTFSTQVAVAASNGKFQFRNPAGSNLVAVFERITTFSVPVQADQPQLAMGASNVDFATITPTPNVNMDARSRQSTAMIFSQTASATGNAVGKYEIAYTVTGGYGDFILTDIQEIPLLPGWVLQVISNVANQQFSASFLWRERFLEEGERF